MAKFTALAVAVASTLQQVNAQRIDFEAPPDLSTLANKTLFYTWRPRMHVLPPDGSIGDPCMEYTDPHTGLFHVGYLHNGAAGATTDDLVHYVDVAQDPVFITAGGENDPVAVFDGSVIPYGINGSATLLYTSVAYVPIQWTIPYIKGSETQSLGVFNADGSSVTKLHQGPVIPGPPYVPVNVTGFRDPYVFQSPELDQALNSGEGTWYVIISGGIHGVGPGLFLYKQLNPEFRDWEFISEWFHEPANSSWGDGTWAGRWGFNFEVGNVMFLDSQGFSADSGEITLTLGAEWSESPIIPYVSQFREQLWTTGNLITLSNGTVRFEPNMAGKLDWGVFAYAATGKLLPSNSTTSQKSGIDHDRFIVYVWLTGDNFGTSAFPIVQQGWCGSLATVRELSLGTISSVRDNYLVDETGSWRVSSRDRSAGTVELKTLKQTMAQEVHTAIVSNAIRKFTEPARIISGGSNSGSLDFQQSPGSKFFMMMTNLTFTSSARKFNDLKAGFRILSSQDEETLIYYQFSNESVIIDRSRSSAVAATSPGFLDNNEAGRLRLFDIVSANGSMSVEPLQLTILVDNSVVEVYANDRFVTSTWIWSWFEESTGISFLYEGSEEVEFGEVQVFEGLPDAWPKRVY